MSSVDVWGLHLERERDIKESRDHHVYILFNRLLENAITAICAPPLSVSLCVCVYVRCESSHILSMFSAGGEAAPRIHFLCERKMAKACCSVASARAASALGRSLHANMRRAWSTRWRNLYTIIAAAAAATIVLCHIRSQFSLI